MKLDDLKPDRKQGLMEACREWLKAAGDLTASATDANVRNIAERHLLDVYNGGDEVTHSHNSSGNSVTNRLKIRKENGFRLGRIPEAVKALEASYKKAAEDIRNNNQTGEHMNRIFNRPRSFLIQLGRAW
jgi:hypothetical protein